MFICDIYGMILDIGYWYWYWYYVFLHDIYLLWI